MNDTDPGMAVQRDDTGCIAQDLPCSGCGYNLRSIQWDGVCPECGREAARTTTFLAEFGVDRRAMKRIVWAFSIIAFEIILSIVTSTHVVQLVGVDFGSTIQIVTLRFVWLFLVVVNLITVLILPTRLSASSTKWMELVRWTALVVWAIHFLFFLSDIVGVKDRVFPAFYADVGLDLASFLVVNFAWFLLHTMLIFIMWRLRRPKWKWWILAAVGILVLLTAVNVVVVSSFFLESLLRGDYPSPFDSIYFDLMGFVACSSIPAGLVFCAGLVVIIRHGLKGLRRSQFA